MIARILAALACLFLAAPGALAEVTTQTILFSRNSPADSISEPIETCPIMAIDFVAAQDSVVSVYETLAGIDTLARVEASHLAGTLSASRTSIPAWKPGTDSIRFVVDTAATDGISTATITCDDYAVENTSGSFYGLDASIGANASIIRYNFDLPLPGIFQQLDRTNMTAAPANWVSDTELTSASSQDPFRLSVLGTPSGTAILANAVIANDEAGNYGVAFSNDSADDIRISMIERGPTRWLNPTKGARSYAIEFKVGIEDMTETDFFMGVCQASTTPMNADGTIAAATAVGFHFLRSDGLKAPILHKTGNDVVTLDIPDLSEIVSGAVGMPDPTPLGPTGYNRYAIKANSQSNFEFYINDQLVGYSPQSAAPLFLEIPICIGYITNGDLVTGVTKHVMLDRIVSVVTDNNN